MVDPERNPLSGNGGRIDEPPAEPPVPDQRRFLPPQGQGRSHDGQDASSSAPIELGDGNIPGRLRLAEISSYGAADLGHFVETAADPDAIAKTDGWSGYAAVPADRHNVHVVGKTAAHLVLPWIHQIFSAGRFLSIPVDVMAQFSPDAMAVMEFAAQQEIDICTQMYARYPKFGADIEGLSCRFTTCAKWTWETTAALFSDGDDGLPVFEGRMVDAYDYRAKGYVSGRGRYGMCGIEPEPLCISSQNGCNRNGASRRTIFLTSSVAGLTATVSAFAMWQAQQTRAV